MPISSLGIVGGGLILPWIRRPEIVEPTIVNPGYGPSASIVMGAPAIIHVDWGKIVKGVPAPGDIVVKIDGVIFTGGIRIVRPGANSMDIILDKDMEGGQRVSWEYTGNAVREVSGRAVSNDTHRVRNRLWIAVVHMGVPVIHMGDLVYHTP